MIRIANVLQATSEMTGFSRSQLTSASRTRDLINARQMAMFAARKLTNRSLLQIGIALKRDHTTVLHGLRMFADRLQADTKARENLAQIEARARELSNAPRPEFESPMHT
jgi:chromosomal replication initiator protein